MTIKPVTGRAFKPFGRVIKGYYLRSLIEEMEKTECPSDRVVYEPSVRSLETLKINRQFSEEAYGGMPIQIGYCNGRNHLLNAVEYHRDSELNLACTDMILLVGKRQDIGRDYTYDTGKMQAFLVKKGTLVEIYSTTLHYAPISAGEHENFRCVVVLPRGTNEPLPACRGKAHTKEDQLLTHVNKWLIAHPESGLDKDGAFVGLKGENIRL
ncbi:MAG: DUF4867 family protein [Eubacteriales bacterium]|nr:DUF4867 family protein [Clostridiales bacterium]MDY2771054.1 DUF4867 family protein [Eubacteriales bacterium]